MSDIKKMMVPLAFSPYSEGIVKYSVNLAKALDVQKILFVNIINQRDVEAVERVTSFGYEVDGEHYVDEIEKERVVALEAMLDKIDFPSDRMKLIISVGNPTEKLLKYAVKENIDMIVMGIKAKSDFVHAFTGSVAEKLFRRSPVTIVSYREEKIARELRKHIHI
ncbi:MAG: universal stress protein [Desulfobulbaceae bacterium]|nr:universal stress protein [Desulfobulbaceae bacterium]